MKTIKFLMVFVTMVLLFCKNMFAQNPAAPYPAPTYVNGCSWTTNQGALTNDLISNFYTTGGITNIQNYFSGCGSQQVPNNYTLYPPIPTKLLTVARGQQFKVHCAASTQFAQGIRVWVDWNQSNTYQNPTNATPVGELIASTPNTISDNGNSPSDTVFYHSPFITVPMSALCGPTRMRVRSVFANTTFDPSAQYTYGEVEEYWVVVTGNPATTPPTVIDADTSICQGSDITIQASATGTISFFSQLYLNTQLTAAATNVITPTSFTFLGLTRDTSVYIQNLDNNCKSARTQVRIQVEPIRTIDVLPADTSICELDSAILRGHIDTVATIFKTFNSVAFANSQITNFANRIPDNNATQHPGSFLRNYIDVNNVAPLSLVPGSIVEVGVRITHNRLKDVDIYLVSPNGLQQELSTDNGNSNVTGSQTGANYGSGTGNNVQYCIFRDDATTSVSSISAASITGIVKPENPLSGFTGSPNGTWTLKIGDDEGLVGSSNTDYGRLIKWYIKFKRTPNDTTVVWSPVASLSNYEPGLTIQDSLKKFAFPIIDTKYYFDVYSVPGCKARDSAMVHINNIQLQAISSPLQICDGQQSTLTASATGGIDSTYWSTNFVAQDDSTFNVSPNTTTTYTVIAKNNYGCKDTTTVIVIVNPLPAAPTITSAGATTVCTGNSVVLQSNQTTGNHWSTGQLTQTATYTSSTPNITCTYTNANGCTSLPSSPTNVVVNPLPSVPLITPSGSTTFCIGNSVTLVAPTGFTYNWLHDGVAGYATTQTVTVNSGNNYSVVITDANGCSSSSINTNVVVNPLPATPTLTALGPTSFCPGGNVTLESSVGVSYTWQPAALNIQTNTVGAAGFYTVNVTDANGCTSLASNPVTVTVFSNPGTPVISASGPIQFCVGNNVTLTSPTATAYLWSPTGETTQSITVNTTGSYSVQVTGANGCTSIFSSASNVVVNNLPAAPIINPLTPTTVCQGTPALIDAGNYASYQWSDGSISNPLSAGTTGNYSVIVTDANGCTSPSSSSLSITVNPLPPAPTLVANGATTFCTFDSVQLVATSTISNPIYNWLPITSFGNVNSVYAHTTGNYTVNVTDVNGCTSTASNAIVVNATPIPPPPTITANGSTVFCEGESVELQIDSGVSFQWNTGQTTQNITVNTSNTYSALVTDVCAITHTPTIAINVLKKPVADFDVDVKIGCEPLEVSFSNKSLFADTYTWNFETGNLYTDVALVHEFENAGKYTVILTANSANGCSDSKRLVDLISVGRKPEISYDYSPKPAYTSTPFVRFEAILNDANSVLWSCPRYNFTDTILQTKLNFPDTGLHKMQITATNNFGCVVTEDFEVLIEGDFQMYVPNAFTPSTHDELNNLFKPVASYLDKRNFHLMIYDRWGKKVFDTTNPETGWNGLIDGQSVTGVFNWIIECLDTRGVTHSKTGSVNVIR